MKREFLGVAALTLFATSVLGAPPAVKPSPDTPVSVTNTSANPVPVTGTVSGTVNLAPNSTVTVGNTTANPVLVQDVNAASRTLFQKELSCTIPAGNHTAQATFTVPSTVEVAVIQYLNTHSAVTTGLKPFIAFSSTFAGSFATYRPPVSLQGSTAPGYEFYSGAGPVTIYADPGSVINCLVSVSADVTLPSGCGCSFAGYYVETP